MKIRHPKFNLEKKLVRHYFKGNIFSTHLTNSLHIIFPEGEKFFIRSCRQFIKQIENEELKSQVKIFMAQEGMHSIAHNDFWKYLEKQGFKVQPLAKFLDKTAFEGVEKWIYRLLGKKMGSEFCLSMTAGFEHYTELLAEVAFENEDEFLHLPEEMRQLWFWHASEEIEHKAVAFDLLQHVNDSLFLRNSGFITASILLFFYSIMCQFYFVLTDKENEILSWPEEYLGFIESIGSPLTKKFIGNLMEYMKRDFHPNQMKNDHYATTFFSNFDRHQTTQQIG